MLNLDRNHLTALSEVLRTGSFELAASRLGVTPSAISQRIKSLEERTGDVLIRRGTPCTGTATGLRLFRHAEEIALLEQSLAQELAGVEAETQHRTIRIAVNADSLATWFPDALRRARETDPSLLFDLVIDDQDHSAEWLRRGEVSAAISSHATPVRGCDAVALGALRYIATASQVFMQRHFPEGVTPEALRAAPMMIFNRKDKLQSRWLEQFASENANPPAHYIPSSQAFVDGALRSLGWGMNPEALVHEHLAFGQLVALRPDHPLDTPLYWQFPRAVAAPLRPLTEAIRAAARRYLIPNA